MNKIRLAVFTMLAVTTVAGTAVNACGDKVKTQSIVIPAETMTIQTLPVVVEPSQVILMEPAVALPSSTTTTRTRTEFMVVPSTAPSSTTSVTMDATLLGPNFPRRIANMIDQINMGESNGWISSVQAAALKSEAATYSSDELAARADGYSKMEIDDLERKLTAFNITINHTLNHVDSGVATNLETRF